MPSPQTSHSVEQAFLRRLCDVLESVDANVVEHREVSDSAAPLPSWIDLLTEVAKFIQDLIEYNKIFDDRLVKILLTEDLVSVETQGYRGTAEEKRAANLVQTLNTLANFVNKGRSARLGARTVPELMERLTIKERDNSQ